MKARSKKPTEGEEGEEGEEKREMMAVRNERAA